MESGRQGCQPGEQKPGCGYHQDLDQGEETQEQAGEIGESPGDERAIPDKAPEQREGKQENDPQAQVESPESGSAWVWRKSRRPTNANSQLTSRARAAVEAQNKIRSSAPVTELSE